MPAFVPYLEPAAAARADGPAVETALVPAFAPLPLCFADVPLAFAPVPSAFAALTFAPPVAGAADGFFGLADAAFVSGDDPRVAATFANLLSPTRGPDRTRTRLAPVLPICAPRSLADQSRCANRIGTGDAAQLATILPHAPRESVGRPTAQCIGSPPEFRPEPRLRRDEVAPKREESRGVGCPCVTRENSGESRAPGCTLAARGRLCTQFDLPVTQYWGWWYPAGIAGASRTRPNSIPL